MEKHDHYGHRSRVRDRVRNEGLDNFQDYQVLEYVLAFVLPYKDTKPIAHALIKKFGSLARVLEADESTIMEVKGMGEVSAHFLSNLLKVYNFYDRQKIENMGELKSPAQCYEYFKGIFNNKLVEEIYLVCLTPKSKIIRIDKIAEGNNSEATVTMRNITNIIVKNKVHNIIVAHNHPSGHAEPSDEDDKFTRALVTTLVLNDGHLIDHIIIGEKDCYSYRNIGKIDRYKEDIAHLLSTKTLAQPMAYYGDDND
jgi:DNA repair protein RadC